MGNFKEDVALVEAIVLDRAVKVYKAAHPEWKLIEVLGNDGEIVEIVV